MIRMAGFAGALLVFATTGAMAADPFVEPVQERYGAVSGNVALWGQYVRSSDFRNQYDLGGGAYDYSDCSDPGYDNFCGGAGGFGGDARIHFPVGSGHAVQLEALLDWHQVIDKDDDGEDTFFGAGGGHWIYRTGAMAFGAFGGISHVKHISEEQSYGTHAFGGGEIAAFLNNATLFGQLGYASSLDGKDEVEDLVFGRAGARYFFTENDRLEGWAGYGHSKSAESGDDAEMDWVQLAVNYEHQLSTMPLSFFAGYQGDFVDRQELGWYDDGERTWMHTFKIGVRLAFGGSLLHEDREGARTFDFVNLRAPLSYTDDLD